MQKLSWFERLMDTVWKHSSASDSLYETGSEACLAIMTGAILAGLVLILVLAARVRMNTRNHRKPLVNAFYVIDTKTTTDTESYGVANR